MTIAKLPNTKPALAWAMPAHDPHAGHEHFNCSCGKVFHSRQELSDHARRLNHKPA